MKPLRMHVLAAALLAAGCAEKPVLELLEAQQALATARDAEADLYAPEEYELAVSNLSNAIAAIDRQEEEPMWARSYAFAGDLLALSIEQSTTAIGIADSIRLEASFQAELLIPEAQETIDLAFSQLEQARRANVVSSREVDTLDADLGFAAQLLREARQSHEADDAVAAVSQARQGIELADAVKKRAEEINLYALELELEQQANPVEPDEDPFDF